MAGCTVENWTLKEFARALKSMNKDNKEIVVPMFQRGKRWNESQESTFIDSINKGYPVGTMLFYRRVDKQKEIYTLVDGLQRGNTIRKFMSSPTHYINRENIPDKLIENLSLILGVFYDENDIENRIKDIIINKIKERDAFSGIQYYPIAKEIINMYNCNQDITIEDIIQILELFLKNFQDEFEKIANTVIPVIVYSGAEDNLPEIFERINSKGTPLSTYEIYAASWPVNPKIMVDNKEIVDKVLKKYDSLSDNDFIVAYFDREEIRKNRKLSMFEYCFGLSRYLNDKYDFLHFDNKSKDDVIITMGFELVNACINNSNDRIKSLYLELEDIDMNLFQKRLIECIEFVGNIISNVTMFKGNRRNKNSILHSKYQIMSMISTTFREKYDISNLNKEKNTWMVNGELLEKNMLHHYINDIIRKEWNEGGTSKIHKVAKPNKYLTKISRNMWESTLNAYFEQNNIRQESKSVANPKKEDIVILNCIYLSLFSALDQLSLEKFDIEHIATKDQMKKLVSACKSNGLPISSIGNLCYLPQNINRGKGSKNFYQDINYNSDIDIRQIETKFSFTTLEDMEWMDIPYNLDDKEILKEYYLNFLNKRFERQKEMFYKALKIEEEEDPESSYDETELSNECDSNNKDKVANIKEDQELIREHLRCSLENVFNVKLVKKSKAILVSDDKSVGIALSVSQKYIQGNREKYWFAYRTSTLENLKGCKKIFVAYGCGSDGKLFIIPIDVLEHTKHRMRYTEKDGKIHWHVVFYSDKNNNFTWRLSTPIAEEIEINRYMV